MHCGLALVNENNFMSDNEMIGTVVQVCTNGGKCSQCGSPANQVEEDGYAYFVCGTAIKGNQIKVVHDSNNLAFCEIDIACDEDAQYGIYFANFPYSR